MTIPDTKLAQLLTTASDLPGASLGVRILVSRLRIEVRAQPAAIAAKQAELKTYLQKNPDAAAELAKC
jgi:hypothetical protein